MPANNAPVTQPATVSAAADTPYIFQLGDFAFDDSADAPNPNTFANVLVRTLPSPGVLMFDADGAGGAAAVEVTIGQVISAADITAGHLSFEPGAFASGNNYAFFEFQVQDNGPGAALYATGPLPRGVIAIDINHDSKLDLVYISDDTATGQIGVRFGAGDGTFGEESRIAVGDTPSTLIAADLDGDNNPDLVMANYVDNTVQVLKGNADGSFESPVTIAVLNSEAIVAGDFNHDGFTDLAITERNNNLVDILLGDGTGAGFTTLSYDNGANGSVTTSVAVADLDEDGEMDLIFAQENDQFNTPNTGSITFVLGNADGSFQGAQDIATGLGHAYVVKIADLNSDGHADVVYTTVETPGSIIVQLGVGDGTFLAPTTISQPAPAEGLVIADIDGDNKLDLVVTDYQPDGSVSVLRGNGDGTFQSAIHIPAASYPFSITTGDLNGDGKPDIITTNYIDNNLSVLLNGDTLLDGDDNTSDLAIINIDIAGSNHEPTADAGGPYAVQAGDSLNLSGSGSDADNDTLTYSWDLNDDTVFGDAVGATPTLTASQLQALGITSGSYTISLRVSDGQGGETTSVSTLYVNNAPFANPDSVDATEDTPITIDGATLFGNDDDPDFSTLSITAVSDAQGGSVTLNGGNPIFTPDANFNGPASFIYEVSDGHGGTASATATVNVAAVNDAPVTQSVTVSTEEDTAYVFQLADFDFADPSDQPNPDSLANVVIRTLPGSGALMFDADGAGGNAAVEVKIGQVIATADITAGHLSYVPGADGNGDGYASFDFQVQDNGAGPALYQTGQFPRSVLAIDVNHDSKLDLVYVSDDTAAGQLGVRLGAGDGTFGEETRVAVGDTPAALIAVDLDGDTNPDLVVTNSGGNNVQVLKGNADGTFQSPVVIDTERSVAVVAGDFNHDGFADLAIADREHSEVRILLGDGTGTGFTTAVYNNGSNGSVTTGVAAADFNEDGEMDLVFASENDQFNTLNSGNVTLVLGNADGTFQAAQNVAINLGHTFAVKTADFNGDGHADLAYTIIDTPGAVVVRLGFGDGTFDAPETVALDGATIDVAVADIDGDGQLDLIATDYQPAGSLSVLRGNGDGTFQSAVHVPAASSPFSVGTGDLNGDNKPDIVTTNYFDNNLSVLLNGDTLLNGNANISGTATISIDVAAVNDAPANTIAAQTATEDTDSPITGLSVADVDIDFGHITVTLTVQHGTIHVADDVLGGLDSFDITNNDTASVTLSCDPALVNATLASGITYRPDANFNGADTLTMLSDDGANDGTAIDGAKTDSDTVDIAIAAVNDAPTITATRDPNAIVRVSTSAAGVQGNHDSFGPVFSPDGTRIAFYSEASNLVAGDTNNTSDIFVKDLVTGTITRVSTNAAGAQGDGYSMNPSFSADGSKIAFGSVASNLVPGDNNFVSDVFVKDLASGAIARVGGNNVGDPSYSPVLSADGSKVAFYSYASNFVAGDVNNLPDVFVKDFTTGTITLVSSNAAGIEGNSGSLHPVFSPDGGKVAFYSFASNLVAGDGNGVADLFVKDLASGEITRVSTAANGAEGNDASFGAVFSPDGSKIAFYSYASNLVSGDSNGAADVFVKDLATDEVTRVSTSAAGVQGTRDSFSPVFSPDGSKIAFFSDAINLVTGDSNGVTDVFVKDLTTGAITRVSTNAVGAQGNQSSQFAAFSPDGSRVAFYSSASNLVTGDSNGVADVFVKNVGPGSEDPAAYIENAAAVRVNTRSVTVTDIDNAAFGGGSLTAALTAGSHAGDGLTLILSMTPGTGIEVAGSAVKYNGTTIGSQSGIGTASLAVALNASADVAAVQALAGAVGFSSSSDDPTDDTRTVTFTLIDGSGTANGGHDTGAFTQTVLVTPVNDAPVNTVPGAIHTSGEVDHAIAGLSVSDPDATSLTTTLHVDHGTLTVAAVGGAAVGGSGTDTVTLTGSVAQINAALSAANNVLYHGTLLGGIDQLTITSTDGGGTGTGGTLSDTDTAAINPRHESDFNGDNFSDILFRNNSTGDTGYTDIHNNAFQSLGGSPVAWSVAGAGDYNGDNFSDILFRNNSTGDTGYTDIHNNAFHSLGGSPVAWSVVGSGDYNGDSFSDILFRNNATGDTGYTDIHNNAFHSLGGSPAAWSVVGSGDYNGDSFSDILFRNNSTGDTGYTDIHNNAFHSLGGSPAAWSVVGSGDYNGDSFSDILFRNNSTGDTGYTDIHNNVFHSLGGSPVAWSVVASGDYNGDSFADILFRNNSTGDTGYTDIHNNVFHSLGGSPASYLVVA
jgi:Tol biopolymer transport system component